MTIFSALRVLIAQMDENAKREITIRPYKARQLLIEMSRMFQPGRSTVTDFIIKAAKNKDLAVFDVTDSWAGITIDDCQILVEKDPFNIMLPEDRDKKEIIKLVERLKNRS